MFLSANIVVNVTKRVNFYLNIIQVFILSYSCSAIIYESGENHFWFLQSFNLGSHL